MTDASLNRRGAVPRRMLVICPFPQGVAAGQRLKYEQYFDRWRARGFDIDVSSYMDMAMWRVVYEKGHYAAKVAGVMRGHLRRIRDLFRMARYDVVYVFMWVTPFGTPVFERLTRRLAKRLVLDVEDNVLLEQTLPEGYDPNPVVRFLKGPGKIRFLIAKADHVIASSPFLADFCRDISEKRAATYISSSIDTRTFVPAPPRAPDRPVTIGWTGTFSSKPFLDLLEDVFQRLAARRRFRLKVIGNFDYALEGVELEVVRWTKEREVADLQDIDIGVYPLPVDDWVLGKSGLKAIQYMAFGLPCVATDVGTTPLIITHGDNGLLVRTDKEWIEALERLIDDPDLRRRLGEAARASAVERYSLDAVGDVYDDVLDFVFKDAR